MAASTPLIRCVGDMILDTDAPERFIAPAVAAALRESDLAVCQVEIPHTDRGRWSNPEASSASAGKPEYLDCLPGLGFRAATLAGNHLFDQGPDGVTDTIDRLHALGLTVTGAGADLEAARVPAFVKAGNMTVALLNFNTVGPPVSWATPLKAGANFIKVSTHYESDKAEPGGAPTNIYTVTDPACLQAMTAQIRAAAEKSDAVLCAFHMGRMFSTAILQYQREICRAAVDAGAAGVFCCHAHNLQGAELYRGRPIFYGLGHFLTVTDTAAPDSWIKVQHNFRPCGAVGTTPYWSLPVGDYDRENRLYMFNEESRMTMIAQLEPAPDGSIAAGFLPCRIVGDGLVTLCGRDSGGEEIRAYMARISRENGLDTQFLWDAAGQRVLLVPGPTGGNCNG